MTITKPNKPIIMIAHGRTGRRIRADRLRREVITIIPPGYLCRWRVAIAGGEDRLAYR